MKNTGMIALICAAFSLAVPMSTAVAQVQAPAVAEAANRIEGMEVSERAGTVYLKLTLKEPLANPPASFSVANPARIAFDFPGTANGLGRTQQDIAQGDVRSANIVQVGDRTRLVLNMNKVAPFESRIDGRDVIIAVNQGGSDVAAGASQVSQAMANFAAPKPQAAAEGGSIRDVNFRRGKDGEGRVIVQLPTPDTGIDIRQQGGNLVVEFLKTSLPANLQRRSDVTDFATPVTSVTAQMQGDNARLIVTPNGKWEHNAYQSDTQFVLEVRRVVEDPNKLVQGGKAKYGGEKLSLNFQNIDVRSVLQVIADFTNFNIITSDSVQGNLTLRLKDVPWDQALDIILQAKGLDMRKSGNVIWIAPAEELATREKLQLEAQAQIGDLEPLQTESFQVNYHKAKEIFEFLTSKDQTLLSKRGSVVVDERSNKLFVTDVAARLGAVRALIGEIDTMPRQVLIEARIVEASKDFSRDLGFRLGVGGVGGRTVGFTADGKPIRQTTIGGGMESTAINAGQTVTLTDTHPFGTTVPGGLNVDLAAPPGSGLLSAVLWNSAATRFINLELSALESDGRGRLISSPRVLTANQVEAIIEQGTEIPYQEATSSGATSTKFKKAVLSLKVRPQITPDGRVQLSTVVHKDRPLFDTRFAVPSIDTKNIQTEVLVENGGTVVIGGIFEEEEQNSTTRIPLLGELPVVGAMFRNTKNVSNRSELLIFITPRIVSESLSLR